MQFLLGSQPTEGKSFQSIPSTVSPVFKSMRSECISGICVLLGVKAAQ